MNRFFAALFVGAFSVALLPSCGGSKDASQADLPPNVASQKELRDMKKNPELYTPAQLEGAGLDGSLGTPDEGAAPAEGEAPATP
ncbi:MAG: hypothetical protein SGI88_22670 [Candidatus Hydrogenedentes bacterium]|nr:hypothetical protein [Candidatus Hydrogenedentota bacterium]